MIYVYAITDGTPSTPDLAGVRGLCDRPLEARGTPELAAVYAQLDAAPRATREAAVTHERVVERLMVEQTVLPARFGTVLRDDAALDEVLALNTERLAAGLDRVRGCVELGVRVMGADGESPRPRPRRACRPPQTGPAAPICWRARQRSGSASAPKRGPASWRRT